MELNPIELILMGLVFVVYSAICLLSVIFTFSRDLYQRIESKADLELFSGPILSPILDRKIEDLNSWLMNNNTAMGPILVVLSIIDMKMCFEIIALSF